MRKLLLFLLLVSGSSLGAQNTNSQESALDFLRQVVERVPASAASGSFLLSGSVKQDLGEPTLSDGLVTVRMQGLRKARLEASFGNRRRGWVINNGEGSVTNLDGTTSHLDAQSISELRALINPLFFLRDALAKGQVGFEDKGSVVEQGKTTRRIRIMTGAAHASKVAQDIYIDPSSGLVMRLDDIRVGDAGDEVKGSTLFSAYESAPNGVMIPRRLRRVTQGQTLWEITLSNVQSDVSFAPSDFDVKNSSR